MPQSKSANGRYRFHIEGMGTVKFQASLNGVPQLDVEPADLDALTMEQNNEFLKQAVLMKLERKTPILGVIGIRYGCSGEEEQQFLRIRYGCSGDREHQFLGIQKAVP